MKDGWNFKPGEKIEWNSDIGKHLYDEYAERIQILDYPEHHEEGEDCWYAGTGIPGSAPNADWAGPCQDMEEAMLEYETEVESFAQWAMRVYEVVITYDGSGFGIDDHYDEPPGSVQEQWAEEGRPWENTEWRD